LRGLSGALRGTPFAVLLPWVSSGAAREQSTLNLGASIMVNLIVWLIVGGVIGWVASMMMHTDGQQGIFLNIIVGIVGAALAGFIISPLVGVPSINQDTFSIGALLVSLVGAVILLAIVNLFRRGRVR
jgi:uncharacterized membrane protein YeaQ/YmgE (transglycosylase-associated protein family)